MSATKKEFSTSRRKFVSGLGLASLMPALSACKTATTASPEIDTHEAPAILKSNASAGQVVVIGGGFGGATAAKYIKRGNPAIDVTLIEPKRVFHTCPFSNLVLAGERSLDSIGHNFDELKNHYGVTVIHQRAYDIDSVKRTVSLDNGELLSYDKLVLSPGVEMRWDAIEGYDRTAANSVPHAWEAGPQTSLLRKQIEGMRDGDTFIMCVPGNPFRCPPGPYERASLIAHYLKKHKPYSKILILDAKDNFSKQGLFTQAWQSQYGDMIEWISLSNDGKVVRVDAKNLQVETEFGSRYDANVLNVIPPQKAGLIADRAGVTDASGWVPVNPVTFESTVVKDIYVVGDATVAAPMPKSGFAANAQAKVAASAIIAAFAGINPLEPVWANTCYSLVNPDYGISVAAVYKVEEQKIISVPNAGGLSLADADPTVRSAEAAYAVGWYQAISQDTWGTKA